MENEPDPQLEALGELLSVVPEMQELVAYRKSLSDETEPEERRELLLQRARDLGLLPGADRLFDQELPPSVLDACVWSLLRQLLAVAPVLLGPATVRELLLKLAELAGIDDFIVEYVEEMVTTGKPGAFLKQLKGGVKGVSPTLPGDDEPSPVVLALVTPYTNIEEFNRELRDECYHTFRGFTVHESDTLRDVARVWQYHQAGLTNSQIAWLNLAEAHPAIAVLTLEQRKEEYGDLHKKEMARLRQQKHRL